MDLASTLVGVVPTALAGYLAHRLAQRRERDQDRVDRSRSSADEVLAPLRVLRDLIRDSEWDELHPRKWAEACGTFDRIWDDNEHRFPRHWHHLHHSVRSAIGEHVGGVVFARDDKRMVDYPIAPLDYEWQQNALEYTGYVIRRLQGWRDVPRPDPDRQDLRNFDEWLAGRAVSD